MRRTEGNCPMAAPEVVRVLEAMSTEAVTVWLEGGWGVDALLGEVTREHSDLDLAVGAGDVPAAQAALERLGYSVVPDPEPGLPARLVLAHATGTVDLHPLAFDEAGNGWLQLSPTARSWSCHWRRALEATGVISGLPVRCISAELQMEFHMRYEWRDADLHDMCLLAAKFGLPWPPSVP